MGDRDDRIKVVDRRAYNRANYMDERRVMMQQWADMLDELRDGKGNVVPISLGKVA